MVHIYLSSGRGGIIQDVLGFLHGYGCVPFREAFLRSQRLSALLNVGIGKTGQQ